MSNSRDLKSEDSSFPTPRDRATPPSPRKKAMTPPLHQIDPHTGEAKLSLGEWKKSMVSGFTWSVTEKCNNSGLTLPGHLDLLFLHAQGSLS